MARLDVELALARPQGARQSTVEAEVLPELVQGEDVAISVQALR
jgi:hypothetical protein